MNRRELQPSNIVDEINSLVEPYNAYCGRLELSGCVEIPQVKMNRAERRAMKKVSK